MKLELKTKNVEGFLTKPQDDFIFSVKASGQITHEDEQKIDHFLEKAVEEIKDAKVNLINDIRELKGMDIQAIFDEIKLTKYLHKIKIRNVAIVCNSHFSTAFLGIISTFIGGEIKTFQDKDEAYIWISK